MTPAERERLLETADKVRENRLRRYADRLGANLRKSRRRLFRIDDRGGWQVRSDGKVVAGHRFELDLNEVERVLDERRDSLLERGH